MKEKTSKPYKSSIELLKESETSFHESQKFQPQHNNNNSYNNSFDSNNQSRMKINSMQDSFLNNCRHDRTIIEISMINNTIEIGTIVGFDVNTLIMENEDKYQFLIMKSAIVKIKPTKFVNYIFNDSYKCHNVLFDYSNLNNVGG